MTKQLHEEYMCANCGFTTPIPNDACPSCGAPMDSLGPADPAKTETDDADPHDASLTDEEIAAGEDDGMPLSLEALKEEEGEEDRAEYEQDSFGDE